MIGLHRPGKYPAAVAVMIAAVALTSCTSMGRSSAGGSADNWPNSTPISVIFPSSAGGGLDANINQFIPAFSSELGGKIQVEYKPGAAQAVGLTLAAGAAHDCNTLVGLNNPTGTLFSWMSQSGIKYDNTAFRSLGGLVSDPTTWAVKKDSRWHSLNDLIAEAKAKPGTIKISISHQYSNYMVAILQVEEATGAKFNIVAFDGGGPARNALLSGEVDATVDSVFAGLPVRSEVNVLAVQWDRNDWGDLSDNAPTVNDALKIKVPANSYQHTLGVPATCATDSPKRFDKLVAAFAAARGSDAYKAAVKSTGETAKVVADQTPQQFDDEVAADKQTIQELIAKFPELSAQ
jgi:putative tricarboxylic transport membrane protein